MPRGTSCAVCCCAAGGWVRRGACIPLREPLLFGKPNWWLTGTKDGRPVEIILDGLTGRHYALKA